MLDNIKSSYILNILFKYIHNKKKLNLIKYNKKLLNRLNISSENFKVYECLKEFNLKYDANIEDIDIEILEQKSKNLNNEGLEYFEKIGFINLKKIILNTNDISNISSLENLNLKNLIELDLSKNNISEIKVFEKLNLINLKKLFLNENEISDILLL